MNQDGETELLLIGAPLFYGEQRGGRVFIYERKQVGTRTLSEVEGGSRDSQTYSGPNYSKGLFLSDHV